MKIALFGATGRVGRYIIKMALRDGNEVKALVRTADFDPHDNLEIIVGNVRNAEDIRRTVQGADAVISAIGTDRTTTLSDATPLIVQAMEAEGVRRVITIGTAGILNSRFSPGLLRYQGGDSKRQLTFAAEEHERAYKTLEQSDLDWTIVCPTYLPDGKPKGYFRFEKNYLPEDGKEITAGDTALFAYEQLESDDFLKSRVGIAY
ncbi:SDR family oxidoreductase [Planococcus sp. ISL-109]|uniref:NAD(P)-dependent oxidoreductase n=1 Tax=Planococcus sp. ISL-109 TaxID=2819166 RepID=UPI001BECEC63|nr:SDR family oxidoreductase [Planococcus sp. ISL-109]MBT2581326.1 SDR family oxidoreductase [Planococcus sp. ISL-109]